MDVRKEELKLNPEAGDFEHVYIKQEEQAAPSSTFMVIKDKDKVKYTWQFVSFPLFYFYFALLLIK
jgi:hypothetical protein